MYGVTSYFIYNCKTLQDQTTRDFETLALNITDIWHLHHQILFNALAKEVQIHKLSKTNKNIEIYRVTGYFIYNCKTLQ